MNVSQWEYNFNMKTKKTTSRSALLFCVFLIFTACNEGSVEPDLPDVAEWTDWTVYTLTNTAGNTPSSTQIHTRICKITVRGREDVPPPTCDDLGTGIQVVSNIHYLDPPDIIHWSPWSAWMPPIATNNTPMFTQKRTRTCNVTINGEIDIPRSICPGTNAQTQRITNIYYDPRVITWTSATANVFPRRYSHTSLFYKNKIWVIAGAYDFQPLGNTPQRNDVWFSSDGVTWTLATSNAAFSARSGHTSVVFDDKMWVIGGHDGTAPLNDVWFSSNGNTWIEASANLPNSVGHSSVVYSNKMWVIGGYDGVSLYNDVWSSTDGVTWIRASSNAGFPPRTAHALVIYSNQMWVIGGFGNTSVFNDVWSSADGITWILTVSNSGSRFNASHGHTSVIHENKMWVIGGYDGLSFNTMWSSADGTIWTLPTIGASFISRYNHTSVVANGKIWVIGGRNSTHSLNDVWYFPP